MNKMMIIFSSEYSQVVKKKSFLIGIFLTPLFMILITLLPAFLASRDSDGATTFSIIDTDGRGLGQQLAVAMGQYTLEDDSATPAYSLDQLYEFDRAQASSIDTLRQTLDSLVRAKELTRYVVIFPDVEQNDSVLLVAKSINFNASKRFDRSISEILSTLRLESSEIDVDVDTILNITRRVSMMQESPGGKTRDFLATYFGALIFVLIVFTTVISYGQILMRSVIEEKSSRIMEVLISSVSPFQLMMGKVLGLGAANLTQIAAWGAMGAILFLARGTLEIPSQVGDVMFNPVLILFFLLYLLAAYIIYSTLFALIGSICNTDKEAQGFVLPITMSMMLPIIMLMYIVQQPDSTITRVLSFIPFLTPTMMVARLNITAPDSFSFANPMIVEATLGLLLCAIFALGLIWLTARVFRMGILMTGKRPTLPEIMKWVRYK